MNTWQVSVGVDHPIRYQLAADHARRDMAQAIAETYLDVIVDSIVNHPRSLQKLIGPSEMGIECSIRVLKKLAQIPEPPRPKVAWKPTQGTALHLYLEDIFGRSSEPSGSMPGRWLTEQKVVVGNIGPHEISGSTDLFDTLGHCVIDHKNVGKSTLTEYCAHGPSQQYRRQAHTYGKGWEDAGHQVNLVMIAFLPRDEDLEDTLIWTEPYDRQVALDTLDRCNKLYTLLQALGPDAACALYQPCTDPWCPWCGTGSSWPRREPATTTAELFT